jgi:glyoxylate/hydroxypyruvate reductase A
MLRVGVIGSAESALLPAWSSLLRAQAGDFATFIENPPASTALDAAVLLAPCTVSTFPGLRFVQSAWAGVDKLLDSVPPALPLARMADPGMADQMAETALWAALSLQRGFFAHGVARTWVKQSLPSPRAEAVHVLVLGAGLMGGAAAARLRANGYVVSAWRSAPPAAAPAGGGAAAPYAELFGAAALAEALPAASILINLLPLTPATRGLLDAALFSRMPRGAGVVNLARGAHLVERDLLAALESGQVGHAVLDVFAEEPLPDAHPFWGHPRVTVLPHIAALTDPASASALAVANLRALAEGRPLKMLVNRERGY